MSSPHSHFFALLFRMKHISRWGLMHSTRTENLSEHTLEVAILTHALVELRNSRFGGSLDAGQAVLYALYHDSSEILTGDMPTPVKYQNPEIHRAYKGVEQVAQQKLGSMLPPDLQPAYAPYLGGAEPELAALIKAADRLAALIKCIEEQKLGNREFVAAEISTRQLLQGMGLPEVEVFLNEFLPSYSLTLDELR